MYLEQLVERAADLRDESAVILGMVREVTAKIKLYNSIEDQKKLSELISMSGSLNKMRTDLNRYSRRLNEILQEIEEINGEIQEMDGDVC